MPTPQQIIQNELTRLAAERDFTILLAVESGSRMWGFPSPDSDYDVRFVYVQPREKYLSVFDHKDTITAFTHDGLYDYAGWDLRKFLRLASSSNATPFVWTRSSIVYREQLDFRARFGEVLTDFFQPGKVLNHYRGMTRGTYAKLDPTAGVSVKKLLYVWYHWLCARWTVEHRSPPPTTIQELLPMVEQDFVRNHIEQLIERKRTLLESEVVALDAPIQQFLAEEMERMEAWSTPKVALPERERVDALFREFVDVRS